MTICLTVTKFIFVANRPFTNHPQFCYKWYYFKRFRWHPFCLIIIYRTK